MAIATTKFAHPVPLKVLSAADALRYIESSVGASKVRDAVDKRLITELKSYGKAGQLIKDETASPMNFPGAFDAGTHGLIQTTMVSRTMSRTSSIMWKIGPIHLSRATTDQSLRIADGSNIAQSSDKSIQVPTYR